MTSEGLDAEIDNRKRQNTRCREPKISNNPPLATQTTGATGLIFKQGVHQMNEWRYLVDFSIFQKNLKRVMVRDRICRESANGLKMVDDNDDTHQG